MKAPRPDFSELATAAGVTSAAPILAPLSASAVPAFRPLLKVCGMRDPAALAAVAALKPDLLGFIFAAASSRFVGAALDAALVRGLPPEIWRVGVFVNEEIAVVLETARHYGLGAVQLHGAETPAQCEELNEAGLLVIKAFSVGRAGLDFKSLLPYVPGCDFFLFDTKGAAPGGNGAVFDWQLLADYNLPVPYLLAGGLGPQHAAELAALRLPGLAGFDLNSGFETAPGVKDAALLAPMFSALRT